MKLKKKKPQLISILFRRKKMKGNNLIKKCYIAFTDQFKKLKKKKKQQQTINTTHTHIETRIRTVPETSMSWTTNVAVSDQKLN